MDTNSLLVFGATVAASTVAAVLAARWARGNKHDRELAELQGKVAGANKEKTLEFRAVEHRLEALEYETKLSRKRYHKLRELVIRWGAAVGMKLRRQDLEIDDEEG
jgi:hypothetical protein